MTLGDIPTVIFWTIMSGILVFVVMARYLLGNFKDLKTGEKVIVVCGAIGVIITVGFAVLQLLMNFLV